MEKGNYFKLSHLLLIKLGLRHSNLAQCTFESVFPPLRCSGLTDDTYYVVFLYIYVHAVSLAPVIRLQSPESLIKAGSGAWDDLMLNTLNKCIFHLSPGFPHQNSVGLIYIKSPSTTRELIGSRQ